MAYNPNPTRPLRVRTTPVWQRLPSLLFVGFAAVIGLAALMAHHGSSNTALYRFIVIENRTPLVFIIVAAAIATFVRSGLRGVIVTSDGVETRIALARLSSREEVPLGADRSHRARRGGRLFELWNGTYERLPKVRDSEKMADLLERVASGRGRQVTRLEPKR